MRGRPQGEMKKKMWTTMRKLGVFTSDEIATITGVNLRIVQSYICKLKKAGYLRVEGRAETPFKPKIYRLIKNTGVHPPYDMSVIYDPNLKKVVLNERDLRGKDKE